MATVLSMEADIRKLEEGLKLALAAVEEQSAENRSLHARIGLLEKSVVELLPREDGPTVEQVESAREVLLDGLRR